MRFFIIFEHGMREIENAYSFATSNGRLYIHSRGFSDDRREGIVILSENYLLSDIKDFIVELR